MTILSEIAIMVAKIMSFTVIAGLIGYLLYLIFDLIRDLIHDKRNSSNDRPKISKIYPKQLRKTNENLEAFYKAIEDGDAEAAGKALLDNAESCPNRNSYCLDEVFCPECPLSKGGLVVQSGRSGMKFHTTREKLVISMIKRYIMYSIIKKKTIGNAGF